MQITHQKSDEIVQIIYPKGETVWVSHYDSDGVLRYIVTSKPARDAYFLYELRDGKFVRLGKGIDPHELEQKHIRP